MNNEDFEIRMYLAKVHNNITSKLCDCPGAELGKINIDVSAHLPGCWIRQRLISKGFTVNTSVVSSEYTDGYRLGVALSN